VRRYRNVEVAEIASAGVEFGSEEADERKARPLAKPEGTKKLVASVLERRLDAIHSGNGQSVTSG
jgi:hypothetical protein